MDPQLKIRKLRKQLRDAKANRASDEYLDYLRAQIADLKSQHNRHHIGVGHMVLPDPSNFLALKIEGAEYVDFDTWKQRKSES